MNRVMPPTNDIRDIRRAVAQLCELIPSLQILDSPTIAIDRLQHGQRVNVKPSHPSGGSEGGDVWL
jgi:hypothetical protein